MSESPVPHEPPIYRQIADALRDRILSGDLRDGDRLPGENALMAEYTIARATARQALAVLINEGLAVPKRGSGVYVRLFKPIRRHGSRRLAREQWGQGRSIWDADTRGRPFIVMELLAGQDLGDVPRGELRVTAPVDFGVAVLAELSKEFLETYPEVSLTLELTNRMVDLVGEGFDAALRFGTLADSSLVARKLTSSKLGFYASPEYLERAGTPTTLDDLERHELMVFRGLSANGVIQVHTPDGIVPYKFEGRLACNDFAFLRRAVLASYGIALIPLLIIDERECGGRLVRVLPDHHVPSGELHFVYPSARHLSANVRAFRDFLVERIAS